MRRTRASSRHTAAYQISAADRPALPLWGDEGVRDRARLWTDVCIRRRRSPQAYCLSMAPPPQRNGGRMFEQLFENFRKASESSLRAQQDLFKQWFQQWPAPPSSPSAAVPEWSAGFQKRWAETATEGLNKHR